MTEDPKKRFRKALDGLDGNLTGIFQSLNAALTDAVNRLEAGQPSATETSETVETPMGPVKISSGVRIRVGGAAMPRRAQAPQPVNPARPGPTAPASARAGNASRPATPGRAAPPPTLAHEVFEDETAWILTAELPGAAAQDLHLTRDGASLLVEVRGDRPRIVRLAAPCDCALDQIGVGLTNGILSLTFPKGAVT